MLFEFTPTIKAGIEAGNYLEVFSNGVSTGIARDTATGELVGYAISARVGDNPVSPLFTPVQFLMKRANMVQTYIGFQENYREMSFVEAGLKSLQTNIEILFLLLSKNMGIGKAVASASMLTVFIDCNKLIRIFSNKYSARPNSRLRFVS
ncbi:MAG: hypothetical protein KME55_32885 [Nostoc indistinguendum CM1-VF10]|jgi:hypothetical protein|nr:hypothetical protein [Nostoc indistinguendum CM1-VF10]